MTAPARKVRTTTWRKTLLLSLSFHAFVLFVLLQFFEFRSPGRGTGHSGDGDNWSATWIPGGSAGSGESGSRGRTTDSVIPDAESEGSKEVHQTIEVQPAKEQPRLLSVTETDPQTVFGATQENRIDSELHATSKATTRDQQDNIESINFKQTERHTSVVQDREPAAIAGLNSPGENGNDVGTNQGNSEDQGAGTVPGKGGASGTGGHQTSFFGIKAPAKRIVYVIDASESMRQHDAMQIARQKLWDSLQELTPTSQFQVIFFNLTNHTMNRQGERTRLLAATSVNLRLAKQFLTGIQPDSGTNRMGAMTLALSYDPDVIYLLTDADAPELSAKDLFELKRANKRKALIHVVEFGIGADLSPDTFLKKLASQKAGFLGYHDLTQAQR